MNIKEQLYNKCQEALNSRLKVIQNSILDIQNALQSETKSSAGDKHETGRAMLQLEREKSGQQLAEIQKLNEILHKINLENHSEKIVLGSVVYTTTSNYFISVSIGEIKIENQSFYAISPLTPIGKLLMSKMKGDSIQFRGEDFKITDIM